MSKLVMRSALCGVCGQKWTNLIVKNKLKIVQSEIFLQNRYYARGKDTCSDCCQDVSAAKGRRAISWPLKQDVAEKIEMCEKGLPCPSPPAPVTYDPYNIKVPDIVVPPLPPSKAKWHGILLDEGQSDKQNQNQPQGHQQEAWQDQSGQKYDQYGNPIQEKKDDESFLGMLKGLFGGKKKDECIAETKDEKDGKGGLFSSEIKSTIRDLFHNSSVVHPDYWKEKPEKKEHPMIDCKVTRGPCSAKPAPDPPICPPPPPKPFPWIYPIVITTILSFIGLLYKYYLWRTADDGYRYIWRPRPFTKRPRFAEDLPKCVQYLIVGTGAAGWAAYRAIKENDPKAKVFFVTKEDAFPYKRPPISKQMWWNGEPPEIKTLNYRDPPNPGRKTMYYAACKLFKDPVKFTRLEGPAVSAALGWAVTRVDPDNHVAFIWTTCGEQPIYYDRCLLAPGASPKNLSFVKHAPQFVRERFQTLRSIRDLETAYRKVKDAKHVTIIGGGPLATELAFYMGRMAKEWFPPPDEDYVQPQILHIYKEPGLLSNILPAYLGEWLAERVKCNEATMMPKVQVYDAFETEEGNLELTLSNGKSIRTDYVLVATGTKPRTYIAETSNLEIDPVTGGILVNTELQARLHLYVAGDAASVYTQWNNKRQRMEHYLNAEEQGFIAGANMTGHWYPNNYENHFWLNLHHDLNVEVVGEVGACLPTVAVFKPCHIMDDPEGRAYEKSKGEFEKPCYKDSESYRNRFKRGILFYLRDDIVVGIIFWNMMPPIPDRYRVASEFIRGKPNYEDIHMLAEMLGFPKQKCVNVPPPDIMEVTCIDMNKSKWDPYEEYEKIGELSDHMPPETVTYVNKPLA